MRYIITTATVVALIAGIAMGFVVSRGLDGSASAAPPPPGDTKVREQNLDGSGLIRVHEQGIANVNVVSMPPAVAGPFEYKTLIAAIQSTSSSGWCRYVSPYGCDWNLDGELTALSSSGWQVTHVASGSATGTVVFTLSRPAP